MRRALIGAALGLVVGAGFGTLLALVIHLNQPEPPDNILWQLNSRQPTGSTAWTNYTGLAELTMVVDSARFVPEPPKKDPLSPMLFLGILLGGGFGAVVGVVTGGTSSIVRAIHDAHPSMEKIMPPVEEMS